MISSLVDQKLMNFSLEKNKWEWERSIIKNRVIKNVIELLMKKYSH